MLVNCQKGALRCLAVETSTDTKEGRALLDDVALYAGGRVVGSKHGTTLRAASLSDLGRARVHVARTRVQLLEGAFDPDALQQRVRALRDDIDAATEDQRELLRKRLAQLVGGVVHIIVGGATASARFEARHGLESALHATYSAISYGMVPGGGRVLMSAVGAAKSCVASSDAQEEGVNAVMMALEEPTRFLIRTTKANEEAIINSMHADPRACFDVRTAVLQPVEGYVAWDSVDAVARAVDMAAEHARQFLLTTSWGNVR
jgi:chaperonin GroEL